MDDREWASLPLELRMWAMERAQQAGATMDTLEKDARRVLMILAKRPKPSKDDGGMEIPDSARESWRERRGL